MEKVFISLLFFFVVCDAKTQPYWAWSELSPMPEPVSNNAVATAKMNGVPHVYSFMGIDTTKLYSGIHTKAFRYNTVTDVWDTIPPVPDNLTRIAASASTVKNKIYIIGGYHVYFGGSEVSSNKLFIYDPDSNTYTLGANLLVATDDHIQCVWNDSLIYVISGWSNSANISNVQIYNLLTDSWSNGISVPNNNHYKAFGASGVIISDTIYYAGGVKNSPFSITPKIRMGIINPSSPDSISWSYADDSLATIYRSGAAIFNNQPMWIGGATEAYNYDGIAYADSAPVAPLNQLLFYDIGLSVFQKDSGNIFPVMDLRGIAQIDSFKYIIVGGMDTGQTVSDRTYLLEHIIPAGQKEETEKSDLIDLYPNPANQILYINISTQSGYGWEIYDLSGKKCASGKSLKNKCAIPIHDYNEGMYFVKLNTAEGIFGKKVILRK